MKTGEQINWSTHEDNEIYHNPEFGADFGFSENFIYFTYSQFEDGFFNYCLVSKFSKVGLAFISNIYTEDTLLCISGKIAVVSDDHFYLSTNLDGGELTTGLFLPGATHIEFRNRDYS